MVTNSKIRITIDSLPTNAKACNGPLMYDPSKFITPDMRLFEKTSHGYRELSSKTKLWSWCSAKYVKEEYLDSDGRILNECLDDNGVALPEYLGLMDSYPEFYSKGSGKTTARPLVCYYFCGKVNPTDMRAALINPSLPIHADNLQWVPQADRVIVRSKRSTTKDTKPEPMASNDSADDEDTKPEPMARKGGSANVLYKVDPNNMQILETIPVVSQYVKKNPEMNLNLKKLHRVSSTAKEYAGFIWVKSNMEGKLFSKDAASRITLLYGSAKDLQFEIQSKINRLCAKGTISEDMISEDGALRIPNERLENILLELDTRIHSNHEARMILNDFIRKNSISCSWVISHHGDSNNAQCIICLNTMFVYLRSQSNLKDDLRDCPICGIQSDSRRFIEQHDPINLMPVYSYYPAAGKHTNKTPLALNNSYDSILDVIGQRFSADNIEGIRHSLFGEVGDSTKSWLKDSNGFPKRKMFRNHYWSYYPPHMNKLNESNPDWLLKKRLNCASMNLARKTSLEKK